MLKIITFLGLGPKNGYQPTTYIKHDKSDKHTTHLFPEAVDKLYEPDLNIIMVTEQVLDDPKGYLAYLRKQLNSKLREVKIPEGKSENELWEIFDICAKQIEPEDEIILDITHGFRSSPLLIFIVAAYLRQVKKVELKHILYGAFEARNRDTNQTPIFDLTPFVELLNWMNAVNVFQNYGDARPIADIAKLTVPKNITNALTNLSNALLTNRTFEAQEAAMKFNTEFSTIQAGTQTPFIVLVEQLMVSYQLMAVYEPADNPENSFKAQYQQIKWYIENQHYILAITLMREWLISWKCYNDDHDWLHRDTRKDIEDNFNNFINNDSPFANLDPTMQTAIQLWDDCKIRGDLAHCGMRLRPKPAVEAIGEIKQLFEDFKTFVSSVGLI